MNTAGGTLLLISLTAIATAFMVKKKCCDIQVANDSPVYEQESGDYFEDAEYAEDVYSIFYSPLEQLNPLPATFTGNIKRS